MRTVSRHWSTASERVLAGVTADTARPVSTVEVLTEDERLRLEVLSNRAVLSAPPAPTVSIPELFAAQVESTPAAVAIRYHDRSVSYRELNEASNQLANLLVDRGARPGLGGGVDAAALGRGDRGDPGGAEDGRRVPAA